MVLSFLWKCNEFNQEVKISAFTDNEFRNTLKVKVALLSRYHNYQFNSEQFDKFSEEYDIHNYYHKWKDRRLGLSIDIFLSHLLSEYDQLKQDFKITVDFKDVKKITDSDKKTIKKYADEIYQFRKRKNGHSTERDIHDASNALLVEKLRGFNTANILSTKHFIVSTDQEYGQWDNERTKEECNIVLLPSYWLAVLLRYGSRTSDDYKSFSKFITLRKHSPHLDNSKLEMIFACVCSISSDVERQDFIVSNLINSKLKSDLISSTSENNVASITFDYSQELLDQKFDAQKQEIKELQSQTEALLKQQKETNDTVSTIIEKNARDSQIENAELKRQLAEKDNIINIVSIATRVFLALMCIGFLIMEFNFTTSSWNIAFIFRNWVETHESDLLKNTLGNANYAFFIGFPIFLLWTAFKISKSLLGSKPLEGTVSHLKQEENTYY